MHQRIFESSNLHCRTPNLPRESSISSDTATPKASHFLFHLEVWQPNDVLRVRRVELKSLSNRAHNPSQLPFARSNERVIVQLVSRLGSSSLVYSRILARPFFPPIVAEDGCCRAVRANWIGFGFDFNRSAHFFRCSNFDHALEVRRPVHSAVLFGRGFWAFFFGCGNNNIHNNHNK